MQSSRHWLGLLTSLLVSCGGATKLAHVQSSSVGTLPSAQCGETLGPSPFKKPHATHVLIADFYGLGTGGREFGQTVAQQIDAELVRFREEELPKLPIQVPLDAVEFARLPCFLESHAEADRVASRWNAQLVIWGRAYCNVKPEVQRAIEIHQEISTGPIEAREQGTNNVGIVTIEAAKPYAVCPSATLHRADASLQRSSEPLDIGSLAHLDLPTLSSTAPFQLINFTLGLHFYEDGQGALAARFFDRSVKYILSPADESLASLYAYLAYAFLSLPGGAQKARIYGEQALQGVSGTGTQREAEVLTALGESFHLEGKYAEAIDHYQRALTIERGLGEETSFTTVTLSAMGSSLEGQGDYAAAETYYARALAIGERVFGKEDPFLVPLLNRVGHLFRVQGKYGPAGAEFARARTISQKAFGLNDPRAADSAKRIAALLVDQAKYAEAIVYIRQALAIDQRALGSDDDTTASDLNMLGEVLRLQGHPTEALEHFKRALAIDEKALGEQHPEVAMLLNNIAVVFQTLGDFEQAMNYQERALAIRIKVLGPNHPDVAISLNNIASVLRRQGQHAKAIEYYRRALAIFETALGSEHASTAQCVHNLADLLLLQGKFDEALADFERAVKVDEKALGTDHPATVSALYGVGEALLSLKRDAEAIATFERALSIAERAFGHDHDLTIEVRNKLDNARRLARGELVVRSVVVKIAEPKPQGQKK